MSPLRVLLISVCLTRLLSGEQPNAPVSFVNDIVPVLTKAGCNAGACHAKAGGGQKGFQLSLLGFEPQDDYEMLVKAGRGRRLFFAAPRQSLLLRKASGQTPHGGGVRLPLDSPGYRLLQTWIEQGAPWGDDTQPQLTEVVVLPARGQIAMNGRQQLKVSARYSDGSVRDVTALALYESNAEAMIHVDEKGLAQARDLPGKAAVMVRYQGRVSVFSAAVPLGAKVENLPTPNNFVDRHVFANLRRIGVPPSPLCDDATFLRRVSLDIAGRLPTSEETQTFLADSDKDKRGRAIERLLRSPQYADYFAGKWVPLLKNRRDAPSDITANFAFHAWLRDNLLANTPYDQIVRELLAATGTAIENPPVAWYKRVKDPKAQLEDIAQLFLGVRMQCAQCHHHPFERWSQDDYYSFAAFFSRVGRKPTGVQGEDFIFHQRGAAASKNVKTGQSLAPAALGDDVGKIAPDDDPRLRLADWMSSPDNPFFAKALVNRYWKHFFKRGLIEPEDDIRDTNPPTNPELLAALEKHFIESGFDLKALIRAITQSKTYQLSATPNEHNLVDRQNYSRFYPRRLPAEVLLDAVDDLAGSTTRFANLPKGTRAIALPDNSYNTASQFLLFFGRPNSQSVCECERVQTSSLAQRLHMINSGEIRTKLAGANGRAAKLTKSKEPLEEKVAELYLTAFSRKPRPRELQAVREYFAEEKNDRQNFQDLIWALMNTKEFLFNH